MSTVLTVRTLQPGGDRPITTFLKKTILKVFFFGKRTNKIIRFNYVTETLKPFELSRQLRKQPSNLWVISLSAKLENLLFSENIVIGQSSFECPLCK